jgi:hypothetical protein
MPLVFDDVGMTHLKNRVEAFVHRVKRNREDKFAGTAIRGANRDDISTVGHVARLKGLFDQKLFDVRMQNIKLPEIKLSDIRLTGMKMPQLKIPHMWLPEGLWNWKKKRIRKRKNDNEVNQKKL